MTDGEIVQERLRALREYVRVLRDMALTTRDELQSNYERRWAVLHGLQLTIECVQDISAHLVAHERLGRPGNHTQAVDILVEGGLIGADLARRIRGMPGFRNVPVREYLVVDLDRVIGFLGRLDDFEAFARAITSFLETRSGIAPSAGREPDTGGPSKSQGL
ncbi:MAG: type VII toxin-antitoxin system HepT family RNase toxin [Actinomycetota bacterium]